jgi:hypothetical protein
MKFPTQLEKYKEPVAGFAGSGTGLVTGEIISEFGVRVSGQTGYNKAIVKTAVKGLLGIVTFLTGNGLTSAWGTFWKVFAFSNWGSTVLDWIFAAYPGGVFGMAERMAVTVRTWSMGAKAVSAELSTLNRTAPSTRFNGHGAIEISPKRTSPSAISKYA